MENVSELHCDASFHGYVNWGNLWYFRWLFDDPEWLGKYTLTSSVSSPGYGNHKCIVDDFGDLVIVP